MSPFRRGSTRNIVLASIAGAAVIIAVVRFASCGGPSGDIPADKYYAFVCQSCKQQTQVSARDLAKMQEKREFKMNGKDMLFKCQKCGQLAAVRLRGAGQGGAVAP
jgi:hypothetical protein